MTSIPCFALRRAASLIGTSLGLACVALEARAQTADPPAEPEVFVACYGSLTGVVYRIEESGLPANCLHRSHVRFSWTDDAGTGVSDHGALAGLGDDDHPQYLRADGSRALTGPLSASGSKLTNLGEATAAGDAVRFEQAVKNADAAGGDLGGTYPNPSVGKLQGTAVSSTAPTNGQVLAFDGSAWAPAAPGGGGSGTSDHGGLSGLVDDDHPHYLLAEGVRASVNGFAVTGTEGTGTIPVSGAGARMMWYPGKAAFRAGVVDGSQWNETSVGHGSVAMGIYTRASGHFSTALGNGTITSGTSSTAVGSGTIASGFVSTAMGTSTRASGEGSTAMGAHTIASGFTSTAMGLLTTASGDGTTAMGSRASTDGNAGAFVYGDKTEFGVVTATGPNQFVVRASGGFRFRTSADLSTGCDILAGTGSFACTSSRELKENFQPVDAEGLLRRIAAVPITTWNYKTEAPAARHLGPTAQDFRTAFGLGTSKTSIGLLDISGVAFAGVQAVERRTRELAKENAGLRAQVRELERRLARLEAER